MNKEIEMIVYEAFIRRASLVNQPFMLKGSYITRQFFAEPKCRLTNDLDWVYMEKITNVDHSREIFNNWATKVTETDLDDGVKFRSFTENEFWRMIDYAMSEDFPTVNTDILAWIDGQKFEFSLDISFNLDLSVEPIPLKYQPLRGDSFVVPYTTPLPLQISWKLHQTLVRPRFKDLFDLIYLLKHPSFDDKMREQTIQALVDECFADNINPKRLELIINGNLQEIFKPYSVKREWIFWRTRENLGNHSSYETARWITNPDNLPKDLEVFQDDLRNSFTNAGFTEEMAKNLPSPPNFKDKMREVFSVFSSSDPMNDEELKKNLPLLSNYEEEKEKPTFFDMLRKFFK